MIINLNKNISFLLFGLFFVLNHLCGQTNEDCLTCHEDPGLSKIIQGKTVSLNVNQKILKKSVHKNVTCAGCHKDAAVSDFPHSENLKPVNCSNCHSSEQAQFYAGIHGQALKLNAPYAPDCKECHGAHDIIPHSSPESRTYKMNIPFFFFFFHKEGAPVALTYNITEHNILENYSEGIHGQGLFKKGLIVTAACNDCHGNHLILPHTSPNSSISAKNIAGTCMKCHARIEEVHKKVIKRELWEKKAGVIPACTDCHPPHKVDIKNIEVTISDRGCVKCHEKDDVHKEVNGKTVSLKVNKSDLATSVHKSISCTKCHTDVTISLQRPCETAKKVDCSNCHIEASNLYLESGHGQAYFNSKDRLQPVSNAPYCTDCHGTHIIKTRYDDTSPTYRGSIPELCGKCHRTNGKALVNTNLKELNAFSDYSLSVHGKGLKEKGLLVSAVCTDCHTTHHIMKQDDERSSVNPENIPTTCAKCHKSIYDDYINSDHNISRNNEKQRFPTCTDCHSAHVISRIDKDKFMTEVTHQCGSCHKKLAETYSETYHGKAYQLGYLQAARCSDCHGAHKILNVKNPNSLVGYKNIVSTCKKCHSEANLAFTGYLTHATHNDNPVLFYTFWGMTSLLLGVFGFFGLHTLLWIPRSIKEARKKKKHSVPAGKIDYYRRFTRSQRVTHIFVILSFILLAFTGMLLKFSHMKWAGFLSKFIGGVHIAGSIHRFAAVITFGYFAFHVYSLIRMKITKRISFKELLFGKNSLMFNMQDVKDFWGTMKWFFGKGPRPQYGRWTYWEKFDYMAVFWGVAVIGFSGLVLWFPEFFTKFFPGWAINVAQIIHSDEALLAVGFIFTIHFFNTHLRPESFPMDTVIFTGHVPLEEYKIDRPREYEELEKSGNLKNVVVNQVLTPSWLKIVKVFGFLFLALGLILVVMIIYSLLVGKY